MLDSPSPALLTVRVSQHSLADPIMTLILDVRVHTTLVCSLYQHFKSCASAHATTLDHLPWLFLSVVLTDSGNTLAFVLTGQLISRLSTRNHILSKMAIKSLFSLEVKVVRQRDFVVVRKDLISVRNVPHRDHCSQHIITIVIYSVC